MNYRLLILVMCSSAHKFKKLELEIKRTWGSVNQPGVKVLFYVDNQRSLFKKKAAVLKGNDLILPCGDGYIQCTKKTVQAFSYVLEHFNFDYIFRTNLGSYIYQDRILNFLADKPTDRFYAGILGLAKVGSLEVVFASGSGFFLSRDLVSLIVSKQEVIDYAIIDDVAIGRFLQEENIKIDNCAIRLSYTSAGRELQEGSNTIQTIDSDRIYHIRLRSDDRNIDIRRMHQLFIGDEIEVK